MNLLSLPCEVLPNIFGFLSLEDRKNVRLTCRSFRNACNRTCIVEHEKFVFHFGHFGDYHDTYDFVEYIKSCKRVRSVVEFRTIDLTRLQLKVWENLGDRITSVLIDHCSINEEILARIFLHCSELIDFHVNVPDDAEVFAAESNSLDQLIALRIERSKLRTFKLFTQRSLSDNTFCKIFKIFPNIKTFGRGLYRPSGSKLPDYFLYGKQSNSTRIELPPSVENFVYHMNANSKWMVPTVEYPIPKFKELEFTLRILNEEDLKLVTDFFSSQTELEKIDLVIVFRFPERNSSFLKTVMLHIMRKLPKLKALSLYSDSEIEFSESEIIEFVATVPGNLKLLDLSLSARCSLLDPVPKPEIPSMEYCDLTHLRFHFWSGLRLQSEILNRCRSLQCLKLRNADERTLECILKDHTELRKLSLDCCDIPDISMEEHSSVELRRLECLAVRDLPGNVKAVVSFVSKLHCPKLKVFRCLRFAGPSGLIWYLSKEDTIAVLRTLSNQSPLLETLILDSQLPIHEYHSHCGNFENLRYLVLVGCAHLSEILSQDLHGYAVKRLFDVCPLLVFVVNQDYNGAEAYFYDRITRSLVTSRSMHYQDLCEVLNVPSFKE